jgi:hypothetical protein
MERELWEQLYAIVVPLDRFWTNGLYRSWEIVLVFLWAVVHDRPTSWACQQRNWIPAPPCHGLPSQSTMSRRLRTLAVEQLLHAVEAQLGGDARRWWLQRIDSKPLPIGWHSHDPDARYGRAAGGFAKGYKLHAIWGGGRLPSAWRIEPMNVGDSKAAQRMMPNLSGEGYVVGDSQFDSNALHAMAWPAHQVIAPQQRPGKALGHRPHHPARVRALELLAKPFGQALLHWRGQIERDFGGLTNFASGLSPLPNWVRHLHRVRRWVQAKLIINAIRLLNTHSEPMTAPA